MTSMSERRTVADDLEEGHQVWNEGSRCRRADYATPLMPPSPPSCLMTPAGLITCCVITTTNVSVYE